MEVKMPKKASERRILYQSMKEKGYCPRCGNKKEADEKYIYCGACRDFFRKYQEENSKSINKTRKSIYEQRKQKKRCPRCGKLLGKRYKKTLCTKCLIKQYKYNYGKDRPEKVYDKK
jgi:ribosomal protein S27AE